MSDEVRAEYLSYEQIRERADEFLAKYHPSGKIPIPIELIVEEPNRPQHPGAGADRAEREADGAEHAQPGPLDRPPPQQQPVTGHEHSRDQAADQ